MRNEPFPKLFFSLRLIENSLKFVKNSSHDSMPLWVLGSSRIRLKIYISILQMVFIVDYSSPQRSGVGLFRVIGKGPIACWIAFSRGHTPRNSIRRMVDYFRQQTLPFNGLFCRTLLTFLKSNWMVATVFRGQQSTTACRKRNSHGN